MRSCSSGSGSGARRRSSAQSSWACSRSSASGPADEQQLRDRLGLHERGCRDFLDALVALGHAGAGQRGLRQHARDRSLPRPGQADLPRRDARDGQRAAVRLLGIADRRAPHRRDPERGEGRGRGHVRDPLQRPGAAARVPLGDDRDQHGRGARDRSTSSPGTSYTDRLRRGRRAGRRAGAPGPGTPAPDGHRLRPAAGAADLRGVRGELRAAGPGELHARRLLRRPAAEGRRDRDGPHPPRLGDGRQGEAAAASLRGIARRAAP